MTTGSRSRQSPIRVVIADDEPHFRHGLEYALDSSPAAIEVVGEAADGDEAIEQARRLNPDVVILDVHMPGTDGLRAAEQIGVSAPRARVLMLTVSDSADDVALASRAGAAGYLLKERSLEEIAEAVVSVAAGGAWPAAV